jgi:hypothetical protein
MAKFLLPHDCFRCKYSGESSLSISGKHIKQTCGGCGFYIKFFPVKDLPTVGAVRQQIWQICQGKLDAVEIVKDQMLFFGQPYEPKDFISNWTLYFSLLKYIEQNVETSKLSDNQHK